MRVNRPISVGMGPETPVDRRFSSVKRENRDTVLGREPVRLLKARYIDAVLEGSAARVWFRVLDKALE